MSFRAPIGSEEERNSGIIWPGKWRDSTPYLTHYAYGIHTGADLNLNFPNWDGDAHSGVYAIGDGIVTYAQRWPNPKYWGKIVVIDHGAVDGKPLFSRYAHVENIRVAVGQPVHTGDPIAAVGNGEGLFPYHLHFDISTTDLLRNEPNNWPSPKSLPNEKLLKQHYVDPKEWLRMHFLADNIMPVTDETVHNLLPAQEWFVIAPFGLRVRRAPGTSATQVGSLLSGARVSIEDADRVNQDSYTWGRISGGEFNGDWLAIGKSDESQIFVSRTPP